ncbi:HlyD family efflux transporter periplasmic adaptor subunit [Alteromonas sp. a30]|nr:HlyD family efflux transporter periplasmic adaptor subunit [Alteromonas sp. a30]
MNRQRRISFFITQTTILFLCSMFSLFALASGGHGHAMQADAFEKGVHNGRLLTDQDFALELKIFEQGTSPEWRVYPSVKGKPLPPEQVSLSMTLIRLGNQIEEISFTSVGDFLKGEQTVYEPHSFQVKVSARYQGKDYQWEYDNFEGRTRIASDMAQSMGVETALVGPKNFIERVTVYGKLTVPPASMRHVSARFPGEIRSVKVGLGQKVEKGQVLVIVQSNESLQNYVIKAPISGVITFLEAGNGEQASEQSLLTITNMDELYVELSVYPMDAVHIDIGNPVRIALPQPAQAQGAGATPTFVESRIVDVLTQVNAQQALIFRAKINNKEGDFKAGQFIRAEIETAQYPVDLAVKTKALQSFRDFTVVYARVGETYEVRMLELGRRSGEWIEVLSGIDANTQYVTENSYLIKADIEKSGAAHDH